MTIQSLFNRIIQVTAALSILMVPLNNYAGHGAITRGSIKIGDLERSYELYKPGGSFHMRSLPLMIVLHGANAAGSMIRSYSGFNDLAEQKKFMVVYPDSYGPCWNDGRVDMESKAFTYGIDDVRFISELVDQIASTHPIDRNRVYAVGFSNGGMMALRLGIAMPEKLAAVATVSGLLPKQLARFNNGKPVPVLIIHGTGDRVVPWAGGMLKSGEKQRGEVMSFVDTALFWARNNGCRAPAELIVLPDADPADGTLAFQVSYTCCNPGSEVLLVAIHDGNHSWPGTELLLPEKKVGKTCRDINATRYIWDFFSRHKRR
jgi:polyhydroxybutyrate depolymerase